MNIEQQLTNYIGNNLEAVIKTSREENPALVVDAFCRIGGCAEEIAAMVMEACPKWADEILLGEEYLMGEHVMRLWKSQDITYFNKRVNYSLARHALTCLVDGEYLVTQLMDAGKPSDIDEQHRDYEKMRADNFRGAA